MKDELAQPTETGQVLPLDSKLPKPPKPDFIAVVNGRVFNGIHEVGDEDPDEFSQHLLETYSSDAMLDPFGDLEP